MMQLPNWDGEKFSWFDPMSFKKFSKRIDGDFECVKHTPLGNWKDFWSFYFSWLDRQGKSIRHAPNWVDLSELDTDVSKKKMLDWCNMISETYKEYKNACLKGLDAKQYVDTLLYFGWKFPKEPLHLTDVTKRIQDYYFITKTMDNAMTIDKIPSAPFCTEPIALEMNGDRLEKFYFVAPAQINKAYVEAEVDGEYKLFKSVKDIPKGAKRRYIVAGVVSDTSVDLDGERMSENAIKSMLDSGESGEIPLRNAHKKEWDSDLGKLIHIKMCGDENKSLECTFELNDFDEDAMSKKLWHSVMKGKKIGFSIGGIVNKHFEEYNATLGKMTTVYDEIQLKEISVTGQPANTNTFIYAISKAMKQLTKKPLKGQARGNLKDSSFAYVSEKGERKLPIHDKNHVKNAMARFNQADIPAADKPKVWRKILAAAKRFGIKITTKIKKDEGCQAYDMQRFEGAGMYLQSIMDAIWQMREDLHEHMEEDIEEGAEMNETLDEIEDKLEDMEEDVATEESEGKEDNEKENEVTEVETLDDDFRLYLKIFSILSSLEYPKDAKMPENYFDIISGLPSEAYIYCEGNKILPHHNIDYTVNRDLLMFQLKEVMDGNVWGIDEDEYLEVLNHLSYHIKEMNNKGIKKSTEPVEGQPVGTPVVAETQPEVAPVETPEVPAEVTPEAIEPVVTEEVVTEATVVEEVKTETTEEVVEETPAEVVTEEVVTEEVKEEVVESAPEVEESKVDEEAVKSLLSTVAMLQKEVETLKNTPVYKTATETIEVSTEKTVSGETLSTLTGLRFDVTKDYKEEEAVNAVNALSPYDKYRVKQTIRNIFN